MTQTGAAWGTSARSSLAVVTEKTLVPLGLVVVALVLGYGWRDHEAAKDKDISDRIVTLRETVEGARSAILAKLDSIGERVAMNTRANSEDRLVLLSKSEFDSWLKIFSAKNKDLPIPERDK